LKIKNNIKEDFMKDIKLIKPDWNNSNINISATLAEFLGIENVRVVGIAPTYNTL
jgi:hypothetical protein